MPSVNLQKCWIIKLSLNLHNNEKLKHKVNHRIEGINQMAPYTYPMSTMSSKKDREKDTNKIKQSCINIKHPCHPIHTPLQLS